MKSLIVLNLLLFTQEILACSFCRKSAAEVAAVNAEVAARNPTSTVSGGRGPVKVIAAKPAIDMNAPIILGDYSAGPEQNGLRKSGSDDFEVPTGEIFGN